MRRIMVSLLLVCSMALPFAALAQSTEVPTVESFETATAIAEPTLEPTLVPTAIPEPPPIDESKIPQSVFTVIMVLVVGIVGIALVGIVAAMRGLPMWAKGLFLAGADSGMVSLDNYVKTTPTKIDDMAADELHKLIEQLRSELTATKAQVAQNTADIAITAQTVRSQQA